jgi:hypothetical protein
VSVTELHTAPAAPTMADLDAWVTEWFTTILERRSGNIRRWCARWWDHPEVVARMWLLFNGHRQVIAHGDALDQSLWMLDHLDRHAEAMFHSDGPFAGCSPDRHSPHGGLTVAPRRTHR